MKRASTATGALDSALAPHGSSGKRSSSPGFVIPPEPPNKDQWVPDYEAEVCMVCRISRFSMVSIRH